MHLDEHLLVRIFAHLSPRDLARVKPVARTWRDAGRALNLRALALVDAAASPRPLRGAALSAADAARGLHPLLLEVACGGNLCRYLGQRLSWYGLRDVVGGELLGRDDDDKDDAAGAAAAESPDNATTPPAPPDDDDNENNTTKPKIHIPFSKRDALFVAADTGRALAYEPHPGPGPVASLDVGVFEPPTHNPAALCRQRGFHPAFEKNRLAPAPHGRLVAYVCTHALGPGLMAPSRRDAVVVAEAATRRCLLRVELSAHRGRRRAAALHWSGCGRFLLVLQEHAADGLSGPDRTTAHVLDVAWAVGEQQPKNPKQQGSLVPAAVRAVRAAFLCSQGGAIEPTWGAAALARLLLLYQGSRLCYWGACAPAAEARWDELDPLTPAQAKGEGAEEEEEEQAAVFAALSLPQPQRQPDADANAGADAPISVLLPDSGPDQTHLIYASARYRAFTCRPDVLWDPATRSERLVLGLLQEAAVAERRRCRRRRHGLAAAAADAPGPGGEGEEEEKKDSEDVPPLRKRPRPCSRLLLLDARHPREALEAYFAHPDPAAASAAADDAWINAEGQAAGSAAAAWGVAAAADANNNNKPWHLLPFSTLLGLAEDLQQRVAQPPGFGSGGNGGTNGTNGTITTTTTTTTTCSPLVVVTSHRGIVLRAARPPRAAFDPEEAPRHGAGSRPPTLQLFPPPDDSLLGASRGTGRRRHTSTFHFFLSKPPRWFGGGRGGRGGGGGGGGGGAGGSSGGGTTSSGAAASCGDDQATLGGGGNQAPEADDDDDDEEEEESLPGEEDEDEDDDEYETDEDEDESDDDGSETGNPHQGFNPGGLLGNLGLLGGLLGGGGGPGGGGGGGGLLGGLLGQLLGGLGDGPQGGLPGGANSDDDDDDETDRRRGRGALPPGERMIVALDARWSPCGRRLLVRWANYEGPRRQGQVGALHFIVELPPLAPPSPTATPAAAFFPLLTKVLRVRSDCSKKMVGEWGLPPPLGAATTWRPDGRACAYMAGLESRLDLSLHKAALVMHFPSDDEDDDGDDDDDLEGEWVAFDCLQHAAPGAACRVRVVPAPHPQVAAGDVFEFGWGGRGCGY